MARGHTFRHRISIYRPLDSDETTQDSVGQDVPAEVLVGDFACDIQGLQGFELYRADQVWGQNLYQIDMRHQPGITFTDKMVGYWQDRTLNIKSVDDIIRDSRPMVTMIAQEFLG